MYSREATDYQEAGSQQGLAYAPEAVYEPAEAPGHYPGGTGAPARLGRGPVLFHSASVPLGRLSPFPNDRLAPCLCPQRLHLLPAWALDPWGLGAAFRRVPGSFPLVLGALGRGGQGGGASVAIPLK